MKRRRYRSMTAFRSRRPGEKFAAPLLDAAQNAMQSKPENLVQRVNAEIMLKSNFRHESDFVAAAGL
jgi:hypothetical protein